MFPNNEGVVIVDALFVWALFSFGWGLSLASYHWFARRQGWSMGEIQANHTYLAILIGLVAMLIAIGFAVAREQFSEFGGWGALLIGLAFGLTWTAILKVYSQISLFLAPMAASLLAFIWWSN